MKLQSPQVLVVEASAGSGKTYCLARRYVQLALHLAAAQTPAIQSILAITFTNKATWAMKSRILDFLKRISLKTLNSQEAQDILRPLGLDDDRASQLAFGLMNDVVRQYHYFQIQTIDSFVNVLLVGCSFKIGLSARFKIRRDSRAYLQLGLDQLLDAAGSSDKLRGLFEDFVRHYLFLENRSGWFPKEDLLKVIHELFRQYNTYQKPLLVSGPHEDLLLHKKRIMALMRELKGLCPPETNKRFLDHLDGLLRDEADTFDVDDLKTHWSKEDFPINKGGRRSPELQDLWQKVALEIYGLCLLEAESMFDPYVVLFENVLGCFGQLSRKDDVLFLEEINRKAALLFENDLVTVEELYLRLAARFRHYLMDEFQDTSLSQWNNLGPMVDEALANGGSLFYVGDKKQAIYAFRGGTSLLFDALQAQLKSFNVETLNLDKNYRSAPAIIAFNNRIFSLDNLGSFLQRRRQDAQDNKRADIDFSQEDFEEMANTFAHARQSPGKDLTGGAVRVAYLDGRIKQDRAGDLRRRLIPLVRDLNRRFALKDIAILTRGNQEVEEITQWLLQEGISVSSERSSDIKNHHLTSELIDLLAFLHSPSDDHAFARFCLGELMPKATGVYPEVLRGMLFDCARLKQGRQIYFYEYFRGLFPEGWNTFFEEHLRRAGVYPLYDLAAGIIRCFGCEKYFPSHQGFFMHLLELIKMQEEEGCDLASFLDYYDHLEGQERFVPMPPMEALKVMTVHKAKGLEFPAVIVPYLEMDIKAGSGGRDGSQAYILDIRQQGISLLRIKESYRQFCPQLQARYEQEYKRAFLGELNSVYVALTRAMEELYIFVPGRVGNAVNPASFLIPDDILSCGSPAERPRAHETTQEHHMIRTSVSDSWPGLREEFFEEPAKSAQLARRGEFYHAVLMHIGSVRQDNVEQEIEKAFEKASRQFPLPSSALSDSSLSVIPTPSSVIPAKAGIQIIRAFIHRPDVSPFFYLPVDTQVFCEKEFVNAHGDTRRIDRLVVHKDEVWIVDFKFSASREAGHQKQMEGYIELVSRLYPKHKVSGYVLYLNED